MNRYILLLLFTITFIHAQTVEFYHEDINCRIEDASFIVDGSYFFRNNREEPVRRMLYFPVDTSCHNHTLDSVSVLHLGTLKSVHINNQSFRGFMFEIQIGAGDSSVYHVHYEQDIVCDSITYLLKTTGYWGKSLISAAYKILSSAPVSVSYEADTLYEFGDIRVYYIRKQDFMPDKNLVIYP